MAKERDPRRDQAFEIWKNSSGQKKLNEIASELGISDGTVRGWKNKDSWEAKLNGTFRNAPKKKTKKKTERSVKKAERSERKFEVEITDIDESELTEKQRLFCLYYVKSFNGTQSAIKAGYSPDRAHVTASELVRNSKISAEIKRIKGTMMNELFLDAMDVLNVYVKIAFADVSDYLSFGQREEQVMTMYGPLYEDKDKKKPIMHKVNFVDFNNSTEVDGTIISEVKQGREGVSIKLADKMKALEKLSLYFDLFPDNFKRKVEDEKLRIMGEKWEKDKEKTNLSEQPIEIVIKKKT